MFVEKLVVWMQCGNLCTLVAIIDGHDIGDAKDAD